MVAAEDEQERGSSATQIALRGDVFNELTAKHGATNDVARARLFGIDRATILRMRKREFAPRLELAMRMAERLETTVEELFERVAA
jgi:DNA-binding XRE family transcriptional regulator